MNVFLADLILVIHAAVVGFIVGSVPVIIIGDFFGLPWVRNLWFRRIHVSLIAFVIVETALGYLCPLTYLESSLRGQASNPQQSFISRMLAKAIYYDFPPWVFLVAYTVFGLIVVALYWRYPPNRRIS